MSNPLWSKTTLAQAIGLAVVGAGASTEVLAQDNPVTTFSVTGYDLSAKTDNTQAKYGVSGDMNSSNAYRFDLTVPVADKWDLRLTSKNYNAQNGGSNHKYSSPGLLLQVSESMEIKSGVVDFEAGHHLSLGNQDVRVFAGLRYVDLKTDITSNSNAKYNTGGGTLQFSVNYSMLTEVKAYGLRAGAETTLPLSKSFSVSGLAAANVVDGHRNNKLEMNLGGLGGYSNQLKSDHGTWYGADLEFALNWDPTPETAGGAVVSLGYSYSQTWNIINTSFGSNTKESNLTEQGAFLRVKVPL